jgi:hypothetical protein
VPARVDVWRLQRAAGGQELEALFDCFLLRFDVGYLLVALSLRAVLMAPEPTASTNLGMNVLRAALAAVGAVKVTDATVDALLTPDFEDWFVDAIKRRDVEAWKMAQGGRVRRRLFSPVTVYGWLRVFFSTLRSAVADLEMEHDPTVGVKPIDTSTWSTYTEEEPNSLTVAEVPEFMEHARRPYPQHYAQLLLGAAAEPHRGAALARRRTRPREEQARVRAALPLQDRRLPIAERVGEADRCGR